MKRKYKIAITFNLEGDVNDIWANGVSQNVIFLYQLFKQSSFVEDIILVSWGPDKIIVPHKGFMLDGLDLKFAYLYDVIDELDVLIEGAIVITPEIQRRVQSHGGKIVCYKMGNDFIMDIESFLFNRTTGRTFNGTIYDSTWLLPHHMNMCHSYLTLMHRSNVYEVPYIWAPTFCDKVISSLKQNGIHFGYNPDKNKISRRISSFESNFTVVKCCFTDILIAEQAYRTSPEKIEHVYMCNTVSRKDNPTFFNFIGRTDLVRNNIMSVEGRYQMPDFLSRYTDIVLSTQWENGLNNAYSDALYGGYPLIHNSRFLPKGVGYYYDQFDAFDGARVLLDVIDNHDKNHDKYVKRANEFLESQSPLNPVNIYHYEKELLRLFEDD